MSEDQIAKKSKSNALIQESTAEMVSSTHTSPTTVHTKHLKDKKPHKHKQEQKKRRRKDIEISRIPGVRRIQLSPLTQKIINCVVGEHVTSEKPWICVKKELIADNLELHEESSEFLPIKYEISVYPRQEMLIGFITEESEDQDEFYICVTEACMDAVQTLIEEYQAKQEARLQNSINKVIRPWFTMGTAGEIDETIPRKNRALLEVEIESKYPILPCKIQFRLRTVEKARDGYMELITRDDTVSHVFRKRIDNATQVTPAFRENEAQTICTYPSNASTQYEYTIDMSENVWTSYKGVILNYLTQNLEDLTDSLYVNRHINFYLDDYQALAKNTLAPRIIVQINLKEYMSFNDVKMCKGKMISCACWHKMITGIVAISYADLSLNIYLKKVYTPDQVTQAVHGINPVLIWSFLDPLNPRLILETHREITTISICPFNENLVIGGATNGQIIIWDITNRIKRVETEEILTNNQAKYRSYMRSLMGWMKDIHNDKVVRVAAVSDLRHSHVGAVMRIQWISPFEEIGRTGKARQFFQESEERSLQFMTAGEDGVVLIWDLLKKPTISAGGYRERRLKRLKKRPAGLSSEVSPFRVLHLNLKPHYKINIVHPKESRLLSISMISYKHADIEYYRTDDISFISKSRQSLSNRRTYEAIPQFPKRDFVSRIVVGTMEGDLAEVNWEGRDFDLGATVNSENCTYTEFSKFHDGPIFSIAEHPSTNLTLTCGGKVFALWSGQLKGRPIYWRRCKVNYNNGGWYKMFQNRFRLLRADGTYEIWCIPACSKTPTASFSLASGDLICANMHPQKLLYICAGISDARGNFRIFYLPQVEVEKQITKKTLTEQTMADFMNREAQRKIKLMKWQQEWCERYVKKEEEAEVGSLEQFHVSEENMKETQEAEEVMKTTEKKKTAKINAPGKKDQRPPPGRYLEWVKEKETQKEQERIKKMILKKKSLDTEQLEKQRKPLLKLEAETEARRKKQRARIKGSEVIFKETVAMLFPAIVKEKTLPPPDPYAGGDPLEKKEKCYAYFGEVSEDALRYMKNTRVDLDFSWKNVLKEGRSRRKYLDNTFSMVNHYERYNFYKMARKAATDTDVVSSINFPVDQSSANTDESAPSDEIPEN